MVDERLKPRPCFPAYSLKSKPPKAQQQKRHCPAFASMANVQEPLFSSLTEKSQQGSFPKTAARIHLPVCVVMCFITATTDSMRFFDPVASRCKPSAVMASLFRPGDLYRLQRGIHSFGHPFKRFVHCFNAAVSAFISRLLLLLYYTAAKQQWPVRP